MVFWAGASGKADIASKIDLVPCNLFLIASISKVFTASAIFKYVETGQLSLDDPVSKWINEDVVNKISNADQATIRHLLGHTSRIPDYFTLQFQLDILNKVHNKWDHRDILKYSYGLPPNNEVGASYWYSNTNYLLLGMILENISGQSLGEVYDQEIFKPLNLVSASFNKEDPTPDDLVKGYADVYGDGKIVESEFLYQDELGTGDGGIAINASDLSVFFEALMKGEVISTTSLSQMTDWFDLPDGWEDPHIGHFQNGLGLQHNATPYGNSVGHTGSIFGFNTTAQYFPEEDATFILLTNSASYDNSPKINIYKECLEVMFE